MQPDNFWRLIFIKFYNVDKMAGRKQIEKLAGHYPPKHAVRTNNEG
jgi:hypothetical protein